MNYDGTYISSQMLLPNLFFFQAHEYPSLICRLSLSVQVLFPCLRWWCVLHYCADKVCCCSIILWNRIRRDGGLYPWEGSREGPQTRSDFGATDGEYI